MLGPKSSASRSGAAAVEFLVVLQFVLFPLLIGIWEVGRLVQVQQAVSTAAREGARLAAQARTINRDGAPTEIMTVIAPSANPTGKPNVKATVMQSLFSSGLTNLTWDDVDVTFEFLDQPAGAPYGPGSGTDPVQGVKNQRFRITVLLKDFSKVRWISLSLLNPTNNPKTTLREAVEWRSLVDDPFVVNPNMPKW